MTATATRTAARTRRQRLPADPSARGESYLWLSSGALVIALLMIAGLLGLILVEGLRTFWPSPLVRVEHAGAAAVLGEIDAVDDYVASKDRAATRRRLLRTGNFDLTGEHYLWIDESAISSESLPEWALVVERSDGWGRFHGEPAAWMRDGVVIERDAARVMSAFEAELELTHDRLEDRARLVEDDIGGANRALEAQRLALSRVEREYGSDSPEYRALTDSQLTERQHSEAAIAAATERIRAIDQEHARSALVMRAPDGSEHAISIQHVVRAYAANQLSFFEELGIYASRWLEYLTEEPRESNTAGGVYPAIFGTVVMTMIMSLFVVPFGVLAALYLREYAKPGPLVSFVRISVNNLAGVPSIVFGVFGLGFFCYVVGAQVDQLLFADNLPNPTYGKGGLLWASLTLALLTLPVVIVATEEALASVPNSMREGSYACGATKVQTILRIVLPRAMPGIITGGVLAIARGAGEVAPLMLVGAAKVAPKLLIDDVPPFLHPERSFLHLGFHIFDLGFQSQNSAAAKPMVFTTALLLIAIVVLLNGAAIRLRARLRRKFAASPF